MLRSAREESAAETLGHSAARAAGAVATSSTSSAAARFRTVAIVMWGCCRLGALIGEGWVQPPLRWPDTAAAGASRAVSACTFAGAGKPRHAEEAQRELRGAGPNCLTSGGQASGFLDPTLCGKQPLPLSGRGELFWKSRRPPAQRRRRCRQLTQHVTGHAAYRSALVAQVVSRLPEAGCEACSHGPFENGAPAPKWLAAGRPQTSRPGRSRWGARADRPAARPSCRPGMSRRASSAGPMALSGLGARTETCWRKVQPPSARGLPAGLRRRLAAGPAARCPSSFLPANRSSHSLPLRADVPLHVQAPQWPPRGPAAGPAPRAAAPTQ